MKHKSFSSPLSQTERILGWVYLPIHIFLLPRALNYLFVHVLYPAGYNINTAQLNLIYYSIGFVFLPIFLFRFLRTSFSDLCSNIGKTIKYVIFGYLLHYVALYLINLIIGALITHTINPNSQLIVDETKLNPHTMTAVAIFLAPFVEEILFRGIAFGTIRKKSRLIAYIVSVLLFAVYHLWQYMLDGFSWNYLLYILQYIPAGIIFAWCYEKSTTIWAPIIIHLLINCVSLSFQIG